MPTTRTDKVVGLTVLFALLALAAAAAMLVAPSQELTAWGYAAAVTLGVVLVVVVHLTGGSSNNR